MRPEKINWWKQLRFRLLLAGFFISVLPLLLLGVYHLYRVRGWQELAVIQKNILAAEAVANEIKNLTRQQERLLQTISLVYGKDFMHMAPVEAERVLYSLFRLSPYLEEVSLFDAYGRELARSSRRHLVVPGEYRVLPDKKLVERVIQGQVYYGSVDIEEDGRPLFTVAVPLWDTSSGRSIGGLGGKVSLKSVMDRITALHVQQGGTIYLVDTSGKLIGHQDFSLVLRQPDVRSSLAVQRFLWGEEVPIRYTSYNGQEVVGVAVPLSELGWGIIIEYPVSQTMRPVRVAAWHLVALLSVVAVLVLLLNVYLAFHFSRPIEGLVAAALEVAKGNFVQVSFTGAVGELASLQDAFNYMIRELREKAKMESLFRQADKLAAVGRLAAGVAHEINNPLAIASAYAEDLLDRLEEEGPERLAQSAELRICLETVIKQTDRCKNIIRKLLDFARPASGVKEYIKLNEVIEEVASLMHYTLKRKGINLELELENNPGVYADRFQLQQVLFNLLNNAAEAIEKEGRIYVSTRRKGREVEISVADTGCGIPPENLERVFEPFFTTKPVGKGTGLGLAICYGIVQELGGKMMVESSPGKGTTVKVLLPAYDV